MKFTQYGYNFQIENVAGELITFPVKDTYLGFWTREQLAPFGLSNDDCFIDLMDMIVLMGTTVKGHKKLSCRVNGYFRGVFLMTPDQKVIHFFKCHNEVNNWLNSIA